ncbi:MULTISPECIES: hypothetical protein [Paenibacillus]|uniref:hypothetical protein n=1 Tax=Paenibacillus TaxID=44249 RepID=UPI000737B157|nr:MULTISPECIES: hypothetical protein [Paenibacillus]
MKKFCVLCSTFFVLACALVLFLPQSSFAKTSDNFQYAVWDSDYAETSSGKTFKVTFNKPVKNVHFGVVLDDTTNVDFPCDVKIRLEQDGQVFTWKKLNFDSEGDKDYSNKYSQTIDPGTYKVYIEVSNGSGSHYIKGNGYIYYDYAN